MSEGRSSVSTRGRLINDAVSLFVNGKVYSGWTSVSITRKLNSISNSYSISLTNRWREDREKVTVRRGDKSHLHIGRSTVIDGYVDNVSLSVSPDDRSIGISGRSVTADLVDCSYVGPSQFRNNPTMKTVVDKMLSPFGVKAIFRKDGGSFSKIDIRQGEKVGEVIDRMAREKNLVVFCDFFGNLIFDGRASTRAHSEIIQGVNMLSGSVDRDNTDRFSEYIVKGQNGGVVGSPENASKNTGKSTDQGISRYRPMLIVGENSLNESLANKRANYESAIRFAKSEVFNVSVQGWYQGNGQLWDINKIVGFRSDDLEHRGDLLIDSVNFIKSNSSGTITRLGLVRPDAYLFEPSIKKTESDGLVGTFNG